MSNKEKEPMLQFNHAIVNVVKKPSKVFDSSATFLNEPRQRITYGAPGTGKSRGIADLLRNEAVLGCFRTTFHPDSDYSTFVGAYKPVMKGSMIAYQFRPQAFINAYVKAWREMADAKKEGREGKNVVLVIEEINRGNCAQIFGDLFQLLDRGNSGYSCYPIDADTDLAEWLKDEKQLGDKLEVLEMPPDIEEKEWKKVKILKNLALPPNLYIWATMNTSDQSLFPIDSAFKRRWDWKYVPISKPDNLKDRKIEVGDNLYDWWDFIQLMNKHIKDASGSEDKQLGYFFVKADDATGYISADTFANKVLFYLYGDAFKSSPLPDCFEKPNKELLTFGEFFYSEKVEENGKTTHKPGDVKLDVLKTFLEKIKDEDGKIISKEYKENKKESAASENVKESSATDKQGVLL
jgi:5-methylcytosine-specific restriction endonuclease McrBC GTP-binding regulatory subunit McrB